MGTRDPRVDTYIAKSAPFARPILKRLRAVVHRTCPRLEETIKWNFPHFMYHGMLCAMAGFKAHCTFGFWRGRAVMEANGETVDGAMGQFGRITSLDELPSSAVLARYVRLAMAFNDAGPARRRPAPPRTKRRPAVVPPDFKAALAKRGTARATFEGLSPSQRREYIDWITEAKRDETRRTRLSTAIAWLAEGKPYNWRYMKRPAGKQ